MWKANGIRWVVAGLVILTMLMGGGCGLFNKAPEITSLTPSATVVGPGGSCTITCTASDPDEGDTITYAWSATGGAISGAGSTATWTAPATEGTYTITVTVSDGKAEPVSKSCDINVVNTPPSIASLTPSATNVAPEESCTISCVASDPDADTLTYAWSATGGAITGTGSTVTWVAPPTEGTYTITVTVSDGKGGTASDSCAIIVEMRFGSIDIQSSPAGATVYLDGMDTGNITPYIITNLAPGSYTLKLEKYHYKYRQATVTVNADETTYINWSLTYASEQTITIQPDATAGKDASVDTYYPTQNYGTDIRLAAGSGSVDTCRAYLQFSLASIPTDVAIVSARLALWYYQTTGSGAAPIGAYLVLGAWDESTITWNNQPTFATTPEYTLTVPATVSNDWVYWYITNMVKGWWEGSILNYGLMLKDTDESTIEAWKSFFSSDRDIAETHPVLIITYYDPTP
jgi:hypothetical protein